MTGGLPHRLRGVQAGGPTPKRESGRSRARLTAAQGRFPSKSSEASYLAQRVAAAKGRLLQEVPGAELKGQFADPPAPCAGPTLPGRCGCPSGQTPPPGRCSRIVRVESVSREKS